MLLIRKNIQRLAAVPTLRALFLLALLCCLAAFLALHTLPASSQAEPVTQEAFWQKVEQTQAWLQTNPDPETWESKAKEWEAIKTVTLPDGQSVAVDSGQIVALLRKKPANPQAAGDFLRALQRSNERWNQTGDRKAEIESLQRILARREFSGRPETAIERFLRNIFDTVLGWFEKLFPSEISTTNPLIPSEIIIALAIMLLLGVLGYIFRDTWRNMLSEVELAEEGSSEEEILSAQQATRRAQQLSSSGDYRQAVRYLYLSALLLLDERGLLRYNRTQTNREYLRQVSSSPRLAGNLRSVVDTFDRVWYGYQPVDEMEYMRYADQVSALEENRE